MNKISVWKTIATRITRDIAKGHYESGSKLPSEAELSKQFSVNRHTVTEMSVMYDYFATAGEDDMWKSWGTSDEYLEVLTLRYTMDEEYEQFDSSDESE